MAQFQRIQRVADLLQRELAVILQHDIKDPRLGFLTVTDVNISRDLSNAKIYISCLDLENGTLSTSTQQNQIAILKNSIGHIRRLLGQRVQLRVIPELRFIYDTSSVDANRISDVIDRALAKDKQQTDDSSKK